MILFAIISFFIAGLSKAVSDILDNYKFEKSIFRKLNHQFWDKSNSWTNKYKLDENGELPPNAKPKFLFATTFLSFTTDAWHLFNAIQYGCKLFGLWAVASYPWESSGVWLFIYCLLIYRVTFGVAFETGLYVFQKKN